jgi:hypothetical protein
MFLITYKECVVSGFYPNDINGVFGFHKNYMYFESEQEAQKKINYIKQEVNNIDNIKRWEHKLATKYINMSNNLEIIERGD